MVNITNADFNGSAGCCYHEVFQGGWLEFANGTYPAEGSPTTEGVEWMPCIRLASSGNIITKEHTPSCPYPTASSSPLSLSEPASAASTSAIIAASRTTCNQCGCQEEEFTLTPWLRRKGRTDGRSYRVTWPSKTEDGRKIELILLKAAIVLVAVCLLLVVLICALYSTGNLTTGEETIVKPHYGSTCLSPTCLKASARYLTNMDLRVDPCDDFYTYACGGWLLQNPIPESESQWSVTTRLAEEVQSNVRRIFIDETPLKRKKYPAVLDKALRFYKSCMNTARLSSGQILTVKQMLSDLRLTSDQRYEVRDAERHLRIWRLLGWVQRNSATSPLLRVKVTEDPLSQSQHVLYLDLGDTGTWKEIYTTPGEPFETRRTKYRELINWTLDKFGMRDLYGDAVEEIYSLEEMIAEKSDLPSIPEDYQSSMQRLPLSELSSRVDMKTEELKAFLQELFSSKSQIGDNTEIIVVLSSRIETVISKFKSVRERAQKGYMTWLVLRHLLPSLSGELENLSLAMDENEGGFLEKQPRWKTCMDVLEMSMGHLVARIFVEEYFSNEAKAKAVLLYKEVKQSFIAQLNASSLFDETAKRAVIEKVDAASELIGYPDQLTNDAHLESLYEQLEVTDDYVRNFFSRGVFYRHLELSRYSKTVSPDEWLMQPHLVNAYYHATRNAVAFPAAILQAPMFEADLPRSVNYGSIGMIIGHELAHALDLATVLMGTQTMTGRTGDKLDHALDCFGRQYSDFVYKGRKINVAQVLPEVLSDFLGLTSAFKAFVSSGELSLLPGLSFSTEQTFFISFAQTWCGAFRDTAALQHMEQESHPLPWFRVNGAVQNFPDFSQTFKCPKGSRLNPERRCRLETERPKKVDD